VRALVSLGYKAPDAERAVRQALDEGGAGGGSAGRGGAGTGAADLIRIALGKIRG
jgi:Holliday junction resolvasome RuvABC DNA-binding subunit